MVVFVVVVAATAAVTVLLLLILDADVNVNGFVDEALDAAVGVRLDASREGLVVSLEAVLDSLSFVTDVDPAFGSMKMIEEINDTCVSIE